jgi:exodeoxyribonuclease III
VIAGTVDGVRVVGGYFPNGQEPGSEKFAYKMRWLDALREWLRAELQTHGKLVLMGDFNIAPEDRDSHDPVALKDTIHHTVEERQHFQALLDLGLTDAFRQFQQPEKSFSWWDYREMGFRRNRGLRIDHILISEALKPALQACVVDKAPRKNERPSDHTPMVVTIA